MSYSSDGSVTFNVSYDDLMDASKDTSYAGCDVQPAKRIVLEPSEEICPRCAPLFETEEHFRAYVGNPESVGHLFKIRAHSAGRILTLDKIYEDGKFAGTVRRLSVIVPSSHDCFFSPRCHHLF